MLRRVIERIRNAIRNGNYDMTHHAVEEMAEDKLGIFDVEFAILNGQVTKVQRDTLSGTKYIIEGVGINYTTPVGVVGRFKETGTFLIITVYEIT
ncbi:MAG: DUF4258 domain-containing protein [bacterium]|nr:DUF4258 domain-containing protein [bacterium]